MAKVKIAAQDGHARIRECRCDTNEQRSVAIATRTMRQKQSLAASIVLRLVQKALNAGTFKLNDFHDRPAIVYCDWSMIWCEI